LSIVWVQLGMDLEFEWDDDKADSNFRKHGISFEEASSLFNSDPRSITLMDSEHSFDEERYIEIGRSQRGRVLFIIYTERRDRIRIISARQATSREAKLYEQG
jgi:uncharacterized protein